MDRVATATLHLDGGKLVRYAGGYSEFERLRAQRQMQAERERAAWDARVAHLNAFITRFRAKASKARQAQSRIKALERMAVVAPIRALRGIDFVLHEVGDCPDPLLQAQAVDAGYPGHPAVLRGVSMSVRRGARIGILGKRRRQKHADPDAGGRASAGGQVQVSRSVRIGYFAQQERPAAQRVRARPVARIAPAQREQVLRDSLGRFGFSAPQRGRSSRCRAKARLSLALMLHDPHNAGADEPRHLDAQRATRSPTRCRLHGAVLLVSHDRYRCAPRPTPDAGERRQLARVRCLEDYADWLQRP